MDAASEHSLPSHLTASDLRRPLDLLQKCYAAETTAEFAARMLAELPNVIPCEIAVFEHMPAFPEQVFFLADPMGAVPEAGAEALNAHMHEHPFVHYYQRHPAPGAIKLSDFMTRRQLHQLGLYSDLFRHVHPSVEDLMHVHVAGQMPSGVFVTVCRHSRDFTERDRQMLNLLRPHLRQAYGNARRIERMRRTLHQTRRALDAMTEAVIVFSHSGEVVLATARARRWIRDYFGEHITQGEQLPKQLRSATTRQAAVLDGVNGARRPVSPVIIERPTSRLIVRQTRRQSDTMLLLDEQIISIAPSDLRDKGLSPREAEVLALVAHGKTNVEIATLLDVRPKTVAKHLERVYQKLGVETRTAAARRVFDVRVRQDES